MRDIDVPYGKATRIQVESAFYPPMQATLGQGGKIVNAWTQKAARRTVSGVVAVPPLARTVVGSTRGNEVGEYVLIIRECEGMIRSSASMKLAVRNARSPDVRPSCARRRLEETQ